MKTSTEDEILSNIQGCEYRLEELEVDHERIKAEIRAAECNLKQVKKALAVRWTLVAAGGFILGWIVSGWIIKGTP